MSGQAGPSGGRPVRRRASSGGVIFRRNGGRVEVALIGLRSRTTWALPKGAVEEDELPEATARREVREETGLEGRPLGKLGEIEYWFYDRQERVRVHKTVHFYLLEYTAGRPEDHDNEVEEVRWVPIAEAPSLMTYANERDMVHRAHQLIDAQPAGA